jgi:FkbM family methyltransferase
VIDISEQQSTMTDAYRTAWGSLAAAPLISRLVSLAQRCPRNWFGKQLALLLRKIVMLAHRRPLDASVDSMRLRCYPADNVSERKFLFLPWLYDPEERALIARELPEHGVFVDIGANVGIYTLWACRSLSAGGTAVAIEPNPRAHARLLFNLEANAVLRSDWPQVRVLPIAIGDRDGELDLYLDATNLGGGSLLRHARAGAIIRVRCRPLLPVLQECGIERIDILKIDIEGAEDTALMQFLQAAQPQLLPRFLIIENSEHLWQSDLVTALKRRGYRQEIRTRMNTVYGHPGQN